MRTALIGYTGFVGSNLAAAHDFDDLYNSRNIADIRGNAYDLVVAAAGHADSFRINNDQAGDLAELDALAENLEAAAIGRLVLVSTVCVYPWGGAPDETTPLSPEGLTPYGQNRLHQEERLAAAFDTLPVRLPQLYGDNLKKGIVYDLAHDYRVEFIRPEGVFQYYDVRRLWGDVQAALDAGIRSLNIATAPLTSAQVAREVFGVDVTGNVFDAPESGFSRMYTRNMTTIHAGLLGGSGPYLADADEELEQIRRFVAALRS